MLPTRFHVPRRTQDSTRSAPNFDYGACTLFGGPFNVLLLSVTVPRRGPTTPALRLVWALPRSLAATEGIDVYKRQIINKDIDENTVAFSTAVG